MVIFLAPKWEGYSLKSRRYFYFNLNILLRLHKDHLDQSLGCREPAMT
jgi:hypothetical protein